jgi:hypothetical protein
MAAKKTTTTAPKETAPKTETKAKAVKEADEEPIDTSVNVTAADGTVFAGALTKVKVYFPKIPGVLPQDQEDIIFSVNGKTYQIQRGVEVEVPSYVADAMMRNERFREEADTYLSRVPNKTAETR